VLRNSIFGWENITQLAPQTLEDELQGAQRDALLALFQPMQSGRRQSDQPGEFREGSITSRFPQKRRQLPLQGIAHAMMLVKDPFQMRNKCLDRLYGFRYSRLEC
jgi:hypothetical protein